MADQPSIPAIPTRRPPPEIPARREQPAAAAETPPEKKEGDQPAAAATDSREPASVARAQQVAAQLTGQCVREVNGVTLLSPPRGNRGGATPDPTPVAPGSNACSSLTPVIAGVSAAQDTPLAPLEAGAAAALERVSSSNVTAETPRLLEQSNTRNAVIVPGEYRQAVTTITGQLSTARERLMERYPALAGLHERFFRDLVKQYGNRPVDMRALSRAADELMAREILRLNGVKPDTNVAGERTIAFPNSEARLAMVPEVIRQMTENPALLPPDVANWVRANAPQLAQRAAAIREVGRALRGMSEATEITNLIATGRLPVNLKPEEYLRELARIQGNAVNQFAAAGAYTPEDRPQALQTMRAAATARRNGGGEPPAISYDTYREIGRQAAQYTLKGEATATFINQRGQREGVTQHNYNYAIQDRRADSGSSTSPEGVSTGVSFAQVADASRARRLRDGANPSVVSRRTAELVRVAAIEGDRRQQIALDSETRNRASTRRNLGDAADVGEAALAARSENLVG